MKAVRSWIGGGAMAVAMVAAGYGAEAMHNAAIPAHGGAPTASVAGCSMGKVGEWFGCTARKLTGGAR
ncbi:hypothetical protein AB4Y36_10230 [Paraburkholderia sp. BR10936]|uniref:hypothetical protein n=1 Tax=Paraburkholderia sp. BR10936 TaxID=3236993 RepID=UPI0034D256A8